MKIVFVSGPFRARDPSNHWEVEQNIRVAEEYALQVWKAGAVAICPHTNSRFFQGAAADNIWLAGYLEVLLRCDAMLVVGDPNSSQGTRAEITMAEKNNIPIFYSLKDLEEWLHNTQDGFETSVNYLCSSCKSIGTLIVSDLAVEQKAIFCPHCGSEVDWVQLDKP